MPHRPRHLICPRFALNSSKGKPAGEVLLNGRLDSMTETLRRHYNNPVPHVRGGGSVTTCTTHVSSRKRYATPLPIVHTAVGHHPPRIQHQGLDHVPPAAPVSLRALACSHARAGVSRVGAPVSRFVRVQLAGATLESTPASNSETAPNWGDEVLRFPLDSKHSNEAHVLFNVCCSGTFGTCVGAGAALGGAGVCVLAVARRLRGG